MLILGISAFFHDSAAAIIRDGEVIAAVQEERFTRIKHDASFPAHSVKYCLDFAEITIDELDAVVFYDKPLLKFERILESYHEKAPKGLRYFLTSMPVWIKQKLLLKKMIRTELLQIQDYDKKKLKLLFCKHHLSHAASAFYVSPYKEAAIITIDGVGEWATTSIAKGSGKEITLLKEMRFPHSVGLLYSSFTYYCGFKVNSGEYKLMGLAPYGNEKDEQYLRFKKKILENLCTVYEDGSIYLHQEYFNYVSGLKMVNEKKWQELFGIPPRRPETSIDQEYCNLALAIQAVTEEIVLRIAATARKITGLENVCLAGGVALNCVANGKLLDAQIFKHIYIQPASGDAGGSLGAALAAYHSYFGKERVLAGDTDTMKSAYLGPAFTNEQVKKTRDIKKVPFREYEHTEELISTVASLLKEGKIIGWFQDRMEFGPRALGNRSILADPGNAGMQKKLNLNIKYREGFRPFAPVCTIENAKHYFNLDTASPYMLLTRSLNKELCTELPPGYDQLPLREKLETVRSKLPAITHVNYSCRVQTVTRESNNKLWKLLNAFQTLAGEGVLINTSFNVRGEPIVCTPEEAYSCFMNTEMDILVINNLLFFKNEQPLQQVKPIKEYSKILD